MSQNSSQSSATIQVPIQYYLYVIEGIVLLLSNGLIFASIYKHKPLRELKEYRVLGALAFTDMVNGLAFLLAGVRRIRLILIGQSTIKVSSWACMLTSHNLVWIFNVVLADLMLAVVTMDRFLSVLDPLRYLSWGEGYTRWMLGSTYTVAIALGFGGIVSSYMQPSNNIYPNICFTHWAIGSWYSGLLNLLRTMSCTASVVLYPLVWISYKKGATKKLARQPQEKERQLKTQRRLLVTVGLCVTCSFIFALLPRMLRQMLNERGDNAVSALIVPWIGVWSNLNSLANLFLYAARHKDMKQGIKYLIYCKELPPNFQDLSNQRQSRRRNREAIKNGSRKITQI